MKKLLIMALALGCLTANAQTFPAPSLAAKTYQVVGVNPMEIAYSSPAVRDRAIFGELVPFGELWRTGANSATTLSSEENFTIGDAQVKAGTYSIFTIPASDEITFILNSNAKASSGDYDEKLDVARVTVPFKMENKGVERMQFTFENTTVDATDLTFRWADRTFAVHITVPTAEIVEKNAKAKIASGDVDFNFYNGAANYYLESGNPKKALEMAKMSTDLNAKFYNQYTLAKAYQATGDKANAKKAAQKSLELAEAVKYDHYIMLSKNLLDEL